MNYTIDPSFEFQHCLRRLRVEQKWTQRTMAKELGISEAYYSDLERGKRLPSLRIADRCAWVAWVDAMYRDGDISEQLAERATL